MISLGHGRWLCGDLWWPQMRSGQMKDVVEDRPSLSDLATVYGSDKGPSKHRYTELYDMLFRPFRDAATLRIFGKMRFWSSFRFCLPVAFISSRICAGSHQLWRSKASPEQRLCSGALQRTECFHTKIHKLRRRFERLARKYQDAFCIRSILTKAAAITWWSFTGNRGAIWHASD